MINSAPSTRRISDEIVFLNGASSAIAGKAVQCTDYRHLILDIISNDAGNADMTIFIKGLGSATPPGNWTAAASSTNFYSKIAFYDYQNAQPTIGDVGIVLSGNTYKTIMIDVDALFWVNVSIDTYNAGSVTVKGHFYSN